VEAHGWKEGLKEKIAGYLTGQGFHEILTNSITNSKYFDEATLGTTVKMLNNLSADLDVLRPSMLQSGLECIAYNINRKNTNLQLFEFGKTYATAGPGEYSEAAHLALYLTGNNHEDNWHEKSAAHDFYRLKGLAAAIPALAGISDVAVKAAEHGNDFDLCAGKQVLGKLSIVSGAVLKGFDIRQQVYFLDIDLAVLFKLAAKHKITYAEVSKFPAVQRDLAMVVNRSTTYAALEQVVKQTKISRLTGMRLFDVFESDKLGADKKSMAISFTFLDEEKTMTDKDIDSMVGKLIQAFEKELGAEIRK
jgi:phenylalanyl-tRNA synthetase beta chain